ncbi:NFX1-type zinc finger-containing protein 1-like [Leguminivora glycinivorella]|uniref:NFX1-type zinc finger-containing protein 1-like n=1 Tax=Leguminivora glycinivorella TaxID=1035111 RepID=UPI00200BCDA2|nr:NFX1-type zinc finger-containing protein 1-like [Leguminivora glycinivorella]
MDEDHGGSGPPGQEAKGITLNDRSEELAAENPRNISIRPNEGSEGIAAVNLETRRSSTTGVSEGLTDTRSETNSCSLNDGSEKVAAVTATPEAICKKYSEGRLEMSGSAKNKNSEVLPVTSSKTGSSDALAGACFELGGTSEEIQELRGASPKSGHLNPNASSEDNAVVRHDTDNNNANEVIRDQPAAAAPEINISSPTEDSEGLAAENFETKNCSTNEANEGLSVIRSETISDNPNKCCDGIVATSHKDISSNTCEDNEVLSTTGPETVSSSPNEDTDGIAGVQADTSMLAESTKDLAAPCPGTNWRTGGEKLIHNWRTAVNSNSTCNIKPNVTTEDLAIKTPGANKNNAESENKDPNSGSGVQATVPTSGSSSSGPSKFYRPPPMRARQQKQNEAGLETTHASVPTVPTFEQFLLQQTKEKKIKEPFAKESKYPNKSSLVCLSNQSLNSNEHEHPQRKRQQSTYVRDMSCNTLEEISRSESVIIIEKINRQKEGFKKLIDSPPDYRNRDVFALVFELVTNVWKSSFEESKKLLLLEICNSKFIDNLQLYLMQLPYIESRRDKLFNKHYWMKEKEFWSNFMTFCECVINVSPATAVRKCGALIEATSKSCLEGLKEKHDFELPEEYAARITNIRDRIKKQSQIQRKKDTTATIEPLESFRELSVLPSGAELLERRPFLRANVVEGAYADVDHYLDVQFRLLREDCFGPLREGIRKSLHEVGGPRAELPLLQRRPFLRANVVEGAYADVDHYLDVQFRLLREDCFGPLREGIRACCRRVRSCWNGGRSCAPTWWRARTRTWTTTWTCSSACCARTASARSGRGYVSLYMRSVGRELSCRELSVLPSGAELLQRRPFLRANVVEGAYEDVDHYLDVQFRLLREDCFGPLREGIHQYMEDPKKRKYDHIRVYRNVKFLRPFFTQKQFGSLVLLGKDTEKMFRQTNWKESKRFIYGSLVLFTKNNCKSFLVGTILQRDVEHLKKRILDVSIIDSTMDFDLYNGDLYTMIECEVYFEPYRHVLKALQDPNFPKHLAMNKYIVDVQKEPENPAYLTERTVYTLNKYRPRKTLRSIQKRNRNERRRGHRSYFSSSDEDEDEDDWFRWRMRNEAEIKFTVLRDETWPSETELGLNKTQYEAYKLALTHEFAVIQGPPGTGKTYLGVKVAKALLENLPHSDNGCSMLVICYTNHALDQFLEALLPITGSLIRIGGRSKSQVLEKHNLSNFRRWSCYIERENLEFHICKLEDLYEACTSPDILLNYNTVVNYAEECEIVQTFYKEKCKDALKHWLFGNVENVNIDIPRSEEQVQSNAKEHLHENNDVDNDIYARDDLDIDDNEFDEESYRKLYASTLISFSLPKAEQEKNKLVASYHRLIEAINLEEQKEEDKKKYRRIQKKLQESQDIQRKIYQLLSQINTFKDMKRCQSRAPRINLAEVEDLDTVPLIERWSYYYKWATITKKYLRRQDTMRERKVKSAAEAYEEARMIADRSFLRGVDVIGMTTTAAARLRKLLVEVSPPIVIVEEAAEVLEAHIVTALTENCKHLILIGDHQQLRPSAAYMRLARHYQLEVSLFERMIRNGVHSRRLGVQHRMRPEIAALISPHIYPDLENHRSVENFPPVRGVTHNLFFFSHDYMEQQEDESSSRTNTMEADFTLRLANYLMQQGYEPDEVTILAAYSGQMFYLRKERSLYDHLSDVKITVLDNYQGEESKIILLSLVRNNDHDSIGFLGTENRICVALSRAREGFFILGNIDLLKRNSTLWTNIAQTLEDNGSLGSTLKLKCVNHGQITEIKSVKDFAKVPEGGCLLNCKYNMQCGHPCPRMCHAYDRAHDTIWCIRDCERKICEIEGHKCPFDCSTTCEPCKRYMVKQLPCGHTKALQCYMAADDPAVYCAEEVTVSLPGCGHETTKPCSKKISDVKCVEECEAGRLRCGHACVLKCHVNDDPDHENYKCEKPCPRAKDGCTANLEGDLGDHQCTLTCGESCLPCEVQVYKKRSGCKHWKQVACREDVNAEPCRKNCARSLPCGHHCKKRCSDTCGDCKQKVKKRIPDCNHEIEIECDTEPTRELCKEKCERNMTCGHPCPANCRKPCDPTTCVQITEHSSEAPCGHMVQLPCNMYQAMQSGSVPDAKLLSVCTEPCGTVLRCGHSCGGSCSGCRQGRLHQPCASRCHQLNICGHRCEEPCNQVCPPCSRRCSVKCPHSVCGKPCGAPCTPCTETPCGRACEHSACKRACGAACSRPPCSQACALRLACGHGCRGLCGEPCPPACRLCRPGSYPTDLLGDPYDDDAKLIQLQDCPHIWDVDTLDTLMNSENESIQIKACPLCREPIINTYRYKDLVNKMLKNDINPIKEKVYGTEQLRSKKRVELYKKVKDLGETRKLPRENNYWNTAYNALQHAVGGKSKDLSVLHLEMYHVYFDILADVGEYYTKYVAENLTELKSEMQDQVKMICEALVANKQKISQQQQVDIGQEMKRMNSIVQLAQILELSKNTTNAEVLAVAKTAKEAVLTWSLYDEEKSVECLKKLEEAVKLSGIASREERAMIVRAIGLKAGHWYKCPNGHFYCIGECGGAMRLSTCPDCGAAIGGQRHALTAGNQHAGEMDGSRFPAWSTAANMANFHLD